VHHRWRLTCRNLSIKVVTHFETIFYRVRWRCMLAR
jgi:hypothetical protein